MILVIIINHNCLWSQ